MKSKQIRMITHGAILAALYVALTYLQNWLLPGTTSAAIQFRASEALCIFALFTPAAIPGLTVGCLLFNISNAGALPLDWLVGTGAVFCPWLPPPAGAPVPAGRLRISPRPPRARLPRSGGGVFFAIGHCRGVDSRSRLRTGNRRRLTIKQ